MNRKLKKLTAGLMLACVIAIAGPAGRLVSWAADAKIAFSDPSVMVGNEVTVSMKVTSESALGTAEIMLAYDPNVLEFVSGTNANGGAGAIKVLGTMDSADQKAFSFTLKFKALQAGNTQISVTSQEIYDVDSQALSLGKQGSSSVKVTSPATYSKDATLKSLKISPGTLTPGFSPTVDSYSAEVDANTTDLVVNAVAANAGAHVSLQGDKGLKAGENQVVVKVTAEDGQTVKNYTIQVKKAEGGETTPATGGSVETSEAEFGTAMVTINGTEYSIASSFDEAALPEGFEAGTYSYRGTEVMSGKGLEKDLLLLYLKDSGGNGGFYIYNEGSDSWSQFVQVETIAKAIVIIPLDGDAAVPEGFRERQADIDGARVTGWVENSEAEPQYCLFYAMNWNGEKHFYRYDLTEKTIQRYYASGVSNDEYVKMANTYNELTKDYRMQFYLLIAVSVMALGLLVVVIVLVRKGSRSGPDRPGKDSLRKGKEQKTADDRLWAEPEEEIPASRIKRYTREEFDKENLKAEDSRGESSRGESSGSESSRSKIRPEYQEEFMDEPDDREAGEQEALEEDDFILEASLEDLERDLAFSGERHPVKPKGKGGTRPESKEPKRFKEVEEPAEDEDDFEFLDLDD
ncbi:cadherin-like beta sandwich domain-containing protein [Lacrimispora brassicae]